MSKMSTVRTIHPKAQPMHYESRGFRGFYIIWSQGVGIGHRLGGSRTVAGAWADAATKLATHGVPVTGHLV